MLAKDLVPEPEDGVTPDDAIKDQAAQTVVGVPARRLQVSLAT